MLDYDSKIRELQQQIKDIKSLKKLEKKHRKIMETAFKPPVFFVLESWLYHVFEIFRNLVDKE